MFGQPSGPKDGDRVSCVCTDCGDRYPNKVGVDQDPPRDTSMCPDCYDMVERIRGSLAAGTWRIRDEDFREQMVELIEENTPYDVYVKERVGDLYVYDPEEIDG